MENGAWFGAGSSERERESCYAVWQRNSFGLIWSVDQRLDGGEL